MKILLLSLLRLGDIVLHRELVKSLQAQHPGAQVDLLIHSQFKQAAALLPEVNHWHLCPRQQIQQILVEGKQSPLCAHALLKDLIEQINGEKYDLILNATHNRFSVRLMDLLKAKQKRGVGFENGKKSPDRNRWQTYFNEHFSQKAGSRFHYLTVLHNALEIRPGRKPAAESRDESKTILLQVLTSDEKKNWGLVKFKQLMDQLQKEFPDKQVLALSSPVERPQILQYFTESQVVSPTLQELPILLQSAKLLITGDTSIQHMAAQVGTPILSLFLGSADPVKTSPWMTGAVILKGEVPCAPCKHSSPCSQYTHLCSDVLGVPKVFLAASRILRKEKTMDSIRPLESVRAEFEVSLWNHYLDANALDPAVLPSEWSAAGGIWKKEMREFESFVNNLQRNMMAMSSSLLAGSDGNFAAILEEMKKTISDMQRNFLPMQDSFSLLSIATNDVCETQFAQFKKIKSAWGEFSALTDLRKKFLSKIENEKALGEQNV